MWKNEENVIFGRVNKVFNALDDCPCNYLICVWVPQVKHFFRIVDEHFVSSIRFDKFELARLIVGTKTRFKLSNYLARLLKSDQPEAPTFHADEYIRVRGVWAL